MKYLAITEIVILGFAAVVLYGLIKNVRNLDKKKSKKLNINFDMCDGSLCSLCSARKERCDKYNEKK